MKSKAELVTIINDIIDEKISACYVASTLCVEIDGEMLLLNISNDNQSNEVLYALAKCYIKYKTPNHTYWELAQKIILDNH